MATQGSREHPGPGQDPGPGHRHGTGHQHGLLDHELRTHGRAVRAVWVSVVALGLTAAVQLVIVDATGSAGLFADALHNIGDVAGTAALWVGLRLSRRPASERFPYGWRRFEDLAGLVILLAIAGSAGLALWDSLAALLAETHELRNPAWALAAALVGVVGNEGVATYKIRVGHSIDSVALVADGRHARVDGLVSLGAAVGILGTWAGFPAADPVAGLVIAGIIVLVLVRTGRDVLARTVDAVEPGVVERIRAVASEVEGVRGVHDVRARRVGRSLLVQLHVEVDGDLRVREAHRLGEEVRHRLVHALPPILMVDVHLDPAGEEQVAHAPTAHHFDPGREDRPSDPPTSSTS